MPSARSGRGLPPPEPGSFGATHLNSYMLGYWLGTIGVLFSMVGEDLGEGGGGLSRVVLGVESTAWAKFWAFALYLAIMAPTGRALAEYHHFTGRTFLEDRIGFAKSGGQDIAIFAGLASTAMVVVVVYFLVPAAVPSWIRVPAIFFVAIMLGNALAGALSRLVYSILFGRPTNS